MSGLCLFIGALAGTCGLWVIAVAGKTFRVGICTGLVTAWFLHRPALKRRQISGLPEAGLEMLREGTVARLGDERTGWCEYSLLRHGPASHM